MIVALSAVACVMVVIGLGLVVQGVPFTRMEWGWTMVLAGTVTAVGGALLAGMAVLAALLGRIERLVQAGATVAPPAVVPPAIEPPQPAPAAPAVAEPPPPAAARQEPEPAAAPEVVGQTPAIVGTYASGGNAYVMYADGSIKADTPRGRYDFGSIDELKTFVAEGGEDPDPARRPAPNAS